MYILLCLVLKPEPVNPRERANLSACLCVDDTQRHSVPCTLSNSRSFSVSYIFFFHTHTCRDSLILHPQSHPHSTLRTDSRVHWRKQTCVWRSKWILWLCAASQMRVRHRSVPFVYFPFVKPTFNNRPSRGNITIPHWRIYSSHISQNIDSQFS